MGFKVEQFVSIVDENLICGICLEVLEDPWQCKDGHIFCKDCITRCLEQKQICPMDNNALRLDDLGRCLAVKNIVESLEVYCHPPERNGQVTAKVDAEESKLECDWTGKLQSLAKHRETCPFRQVKCPNKGCNINMQRRELEDHDKICNYKKVGCEKCRDVLLRGEMEVHKDHHCPEELIPCPNSCRNPESRQIKRINLDDHLKNECAKKIVDCPFRDQGCSVQVERQRVDSHVQDNMATHMMLLAKQCSLLTKQNSSLAEQNTTLTEECSTLKQNVLMLKITNTKQNTTFTEQCSALTQKCSSLTEQSSALTKENSSLSEQCSALTQKCSSLTKKYLELKSECLSLTKQNTALTEQSLEQLKKKCSGLKEELDQVKKNEECSRTYTWQIEGFEKYAFCGIGRDNVYNPQVYQLASPTFWLCGYNWFLLLYPNGDNYGNTGFLSVHLCKGIDNHGYGETVMTPSRLCLNPTMTNPQIQEVQTNSSKISVTCRLSLISQQTGIPDVSSEITKVCSDISSEYRIMQWPQFMKTDDAYSEAYYVRPKWEPAKTEMKRNVYYHDGYGGVTEPDGTMTKGRVTIQCTIQVHKPQ